jgi:hypothetical protein
LFHCKSADACTGFVTPDGHVIQSSGSCSSNSDACCVLHAQRAVKILSGPSHELLGRGGKADVLARRKAARIARCRSEKWYIDALQKATDALYDTVVQFVLVMKQEN